MQTPNTMKQITTHAGALMKIPTKESLESVTKPLAKLRYPINRMQKIKHIVSIVPAHAPFLSISLFFEARTLCHIQSAKTNPDWYDINIAIIVEIPLEPKLVPPDVPCNNFKSIIDETYAMIMRMSIILRVI